MLFAAFCFMSQSVLQSALFDELQFNFHSNVGNNLEVWKQILSGLVDFNCHACSCPSRVTEYMKAGDTLAGLELQLQEE